MKRKITEMNKQEEVFHSGITAMNEVIRKQAEALTAETDEAIKALMQVAGIELYGLEKDITPREAGQQLKEKGLTISRFTVSGDFFFILHKEGAYIAGSIVSVITPSNKLHVRRTMIPNDSDIEEKAKKLLERMHK